MSITFSAYKQTPGQPAEWLDLDVNMSNGNAWEVGLAIGLEMDHCGTVADLSAFILQCNNVLDACTVFPELDPEKETVVIEHEDRATIVLCGRREGYIQERVEQLRDLALAAQIGGYTLNWG